MLSLKNLLGLLALVLVVACGGGGGKSGSSPFDGGTTTDPEAVSGGTLEVSLSNTTVSSASPVLVTATVKNSAGDPVPGKLVDFSTKNGKGLLNNSTTTSALTNSSGQAVVSLTPQTTLTSSTADEVIAEVSVGTDQLTDREGFNLTATNVTFGGFTSDSSGAVSAFGQTTLTAVISGAVSGSPVVLNLSSQCVRDGKAEISPATATTTSGTATFIYKDKGCGQTNTSDTVQASIQGTTATSSLLLTLTSPTVGSIEFVSASPEKIFLKGSGYTSQSTVTFLVKSTGNTSVPRALVSLELLTFSGGLLMDDAITPISKRADDNGLVTVRISAGTVPTPVRVRATVVGTAATTVSSNLSVGVGLPTQLNFTLAGTVLNIEGYSLNGTKNEYTVIASDRTGNPVPVGTAVTFVTEGAGGQITSSGQVAADSDGNNSAVAQFVSARAANAVKDGRVTVLAYALGEESCKDLNGNNLCDASEPFQDLGNIYKDVLYDGVYTTTAPADEFISTDVNSTGVCSPEPAGYAELANNDVTVPTIAGTCDGVQGRAYVRRATELVLSTSTANPFWNSNSVGEGTVVTGCSARYFYDQPIKPSTLTARGIQIQGSRLYGLPSTTTLIFTVADANPEGRLNPMAAGTNITVSATQGLTVSVAGGSPVPSSSFATLSAVNLEFKDASSGNITVTFESPVSKTKSSVSFFVSQAAIPSGSTACVY